MVTAKIADIKLKKRSDEEGGDAVPPVEPDISEEDAGEPYPDEPELTELETEE